MGLSTFDPTTDTVARVTLVDTVTVNSDMRGTDSAMLAVSYTAPDNASITSILGDTNELQANQGSWLTATGFSTPTDVTDSETVITAAISALNNLSTADVASELTTYDAPTKAELDAAVAPLALEASLFDVTTDQVIVATNNDKTGYTITGTITTLDGLDTAQDLQHAATLSAISAQTVDLKGVSDKDLTEVFDKHANGRFHGYLHRN